MSSKLTRLFVAAPLVSGGEVVLDPAQAHYLINVMRCKSGDEVLVFNGKDGEWRASVTGSGRKSAKLNVIEQERPQTEGPDLHYLFAPLKRARLDYMVQKATELGVSRLVPVLTRRTMAERINETRLRANAIEAAEQCGVLRVPEIERPEKLLKLLETWDQDRLLIFADEQAPANSPLVVLTAQKNGPLAVLIGPEGGFEADERALLLKQPFVVPISLGPRIMRADTAAVSALSLVNAVLGDWR
ncbi:MAG: 16S rRNA (uracil(1498)-N(3))-methyltransferase [Methyloceanibacter sp.]|jgi:16S rRNA (uracil1498-N3)-methyltransferase|nr:16S rRNA (uracil(1498)-N(3))-methyltransferase [Methyloceanibacter sp.]